MLVRGAAGTILIAAAVAKLAAPRRSQAALTPFAPPTPFGPLALLALLTAVQLRLGSALARGVGALRLAVAPQAALEIPDEGPELGARVDLIRGFEPGPDAETALAVFTSDGCHVCRALEPAIEFTGRDPLVALRVFDEHRDERAWRMLDVPGSPFAVALDLDGTVLAKGTFNTLGQLESVLATAARRRRGTGVHA